MPIYEYQCPNCQNVFEEWVKLSEAHGEEPCPRCGTQSPRLISHTSFVLKGGGWYVTDYGYRKDVKEDSGSTKDGTSAGTSGSSGQTGSSDSGTESGSAPAAPAHTESEAAHPEPQGKAS